MPQPIADWMVTIALFYVAAGLLFAVPFVTLWAGQIDPAARQTSWVFRVLLLAGSTLLWPWLVLRWRRQRKDSLPPPSDLGDGKDSE